MKNSTQPRSTPESLKFGWVVSLAERSGNAVHLPILPIGEFVYKGRQVEVDQEDAAAIAAETLRLFETIDRASVPGATPWRPPIIREHIPNGSSWGRVVDVWADDFALWAAVEFSAATLEEIDREEVQWFSPKLVPDYVDQWGNVYDRVVLEVSLTSNPKLKHLGRVQDYIQLSEGLLMEEEEKVESEAPAEAGDLGNRIAALEEVVAVLVEKMNAMEAPAEMAEEEPPKGEELSDPFARVEKHLLELSEKLSALEKKPVRFMTAERGNQGPVPTTRNREEELRKQGLKGSDLVARLAGWE